MTNDEIRLVLSVYCQSIIEDIVHEIELDEKGPPELCMMERPSEDEDCIQQFRNYMEEK